jgi:hypothetical protein
MWLISFFGDLLLHCLIKSENVHAMMSPHQDRLIPVFREVHDLLGFPYFVVSVFCAALSACLCFMLLWYSFISRFVIAILSRLV